MSLRNIAVEERTSSENKKLCECGHCNELIPVYDKRWKRERHFKHGHHVYGRVMEKHPMWKGGTCMTSRGYRMIKKPDHPRADKRGYVREQVLVMEQYLGRHLTKEEVVHHINHIKTDNRIENLQLFSSHAEHISKGHNRRQEMENRRCCICGSGQTRKSKNGSPMWFLGPSEGMYKCGKCYDTERYDKVRKKQSGLTTTMAFSRVDYELDSLLCCKNLPYHLSFSNHVIKLAK